ncbi:MAG: hypothetical protein PHW82_00875 [Bacteroidales bacterium]|nr:hypothetical protein [Bacteroidales bacterium]MDD4235390.1 hypothetical protein [Bacteroidales bacterium]
MKNRDELLSIIQKNKEQFPVNFSLMQVSKLRKGNNATMINVNKYKSNKILIDPFYKSISRMI